MVYRSFGVGRPKNTYCRCDFFSKFRIFCRKAYALNFVIIHYSILSRFYQLLNKVANYDEISSTFK